MFDNGSKTSFLSKSFVKPVIVPTVKKNYQPEMGNGSTTVLEETDKESIKL